MTNDSIVELLVWIAQNSFTESALLTPCPNRLIDVEALFWKMKELGLVNEETALEVNARLDLQEEE